MDGFDMGNDLVSLDLVEEGADVGIGHAIGDGLAGQEFARNGNHLVPAVQDADLHPLVVVHAVRKGR